MFQSKQPRSGYCHCKAATHAYCSNCQTVRSIYLETQAKVCKVGRINLRGHRVLCGACDNEIARMYRKDDVGREYLSLVKGSDIPFIRGEDKE